MADKKNGSRGSGKSPRYSESYGANRPNPYTGYLPPGAAPAGQMYRPDAVNMQKVGKMMSENASNLAMAAANRAVEDSAAKQAAEQNTAPQPAATAPQRTAQPSRQNTQQHQPPRGTNRGPAQTRQEYVPSRRQRKQNSSAPQRTPQRQISEEERERLRSIQEEAAAAMVTEVLSETIAGAAEKSKPHAQLPTQQMPDFKEIVTPDGVRLQRAFISDGKGGSQMVWFPVPAERSNKEAAGGYFDPADFEGAECAENPFDKEYGKEEVKKVANSENKGFAAGGAVSGVEDVTPAAEKNNIAENNEAVGAEGEQWWLQGEDEPDDEAVSETDAEAPEAQWWLQGEDEPDNESEDDKSEDDEPEDDEPEDDEPEEDESEDDESEDDKSEDDEPEDDESEDDEPEDDEPEDDEPEDDEPEDDEPEDDEPEDDGPEDDESEDDEPEDDEPEDDEPEEDEPEDDEPEEDEPEDDESEDDEPEDDEPEDDEPEDDEYEDDEDQSTVGYDDIDWETPDEPADYADEDEDVIETQYAPNFGKERGEIRIASLPESFGGPSQVAEQDDTLFIKKERVEGGTEVFELPEGAKLPAYIDDDEFLAEWLNEDEDMAIKDKRRRRSISTIIGAVTLLFAMVGFVWVMQYAFGIIAGIGNTDAAKEQYEEFISPVVMSEVQPFETWTAIPQDKLLQCAVFSVLTNMEESYYNVDDTNKLVIPSNDIRSEVQRLFGSEAVLNEEVLGAVNSDDLYYSDTDDCFHVAATGITGPQPEIISISKKGGEITLMVGYLDETGASSAESGYYMTMQYVLKTAGDSYYISAVRAAETE